MYNRKVIELIYNNIGWRDTEIDKERILKILEWIPSYTSKID